MPLTDNFIIEEMQRCINKIDDFLEYRYLNYTPDGIKKEVISYINEMTNNLKKAVDKKD